MTVKEQLRRLADELPDDISLDDLIERLYALQKVHEGLDDVAAGRTYTYDQIRAEFPRCPAECPPPAHDQRD